MYNSTNAATWLRSPPRIALRRASIQRNDLFINLSSHLDDAPRIATNCDLAPLISTQRNDLFITPRRNVAYSIAALFGSTQGFVCYNVAAALHPVSHRPAPRRLSTICLSIYYRASTRGHLSHSVAAPRIAPQRNDLLVTSHRPSLLLVAPPRNATQGFVCQFILRNSAPHHETQQTAAYRPAYQRNAPHINATN